MKDLAGSGDSLAVETAASNLMSKQAARLELASLYQETADFVWRSLQRLGVPPADVEDLMQEVYVIVHQQLGQFRHESKVTTWLFGICLRVAARHRRRAYIRREQQVAESPEVVDARTPEIAADQRQEGVRVQRILDRLSPEQRAVFVMFEIEGWSCPEIAELLAVPVGTVYSRLHSARKYFEQCLGTSRGANRRKEAAHD